MPGMKKTSGKKSYGAPGNNAKRGNTKKRVRGQAKKRARRAGKKAANENVCEAGHKHDWIDVSQNGAKHREYVCGACGKTITRPWRDTRWPSGDANENIRETIRQKIQTEIYDMVVSEMLKGNVIEATTEKHKMSRDEWNKMPKAYKLVKNGQKYALVHDKGAAILAPIELTEAPKSLRELPKNGDRVEGPLGFYGKVVQKDGATVTVDWGDAGADDYNIDSLKKLRSGLWKVR